jgi:hypothetical protein
VDNIAKNILDALKGVVFEDDFLVVRCLACRIDTREDYEIVERGGNAEAVLRLVSILADGPERVLWPSGWRKWMKSSVEYLEAARIEELESELKLEGYDVLRDVPMGDARIDLAARRGEETVAIEVVAGSRLAKLAPLIGRLRQEAYERGFKEFRLAVANPAREVNVDIAGLDAELFRHFSNDLPGKLHEFPARATVEQDIEPDSPDTEPVPWSLQWATVEQVSHIEPDMVGVTSRGIHVAGTGVVDVALSYGDRESDGGSLLRMDFPFTFDVLLDHDLHIRTVIRADVDISSLES